MSRFIRVRPVRGPQHEYDTPVGEVEANPDLYEVLDDVPVEKPRPVNYVTPELAAKAAEPDPKPSVGEPKKQENHK